MQAHRYEQATLDSDIEGVSKPATPEEGDPSSAGNGFPEGWEQRFNEEIWGHPNDQTDGFYA